MGSVLPCFLCHDPDAGIASTAARDIASLDLVEAASGARGPDYVLKLVITGAVANPGAALGGLLALGDEAVNAKLVALRSALALKWADRALGAMASAPTGYVLAATVEFWLHWLESLAGDLPGHGAGVRPGRARARGTARDDDRAGRAAQPAAGVPRRRTAALEVPLAAFTASIAPRLRVLARLAHGSDGFGRALAAWLGENGAQHRPRVDQPGAAGPRNADRDLAADPRQRAGVRRDERVVPRPRHRLAHGRAAAARLAPRGAADRPQRFDRHRVAGHRVEALHVDEHGEIRSRQRVLRIARHARRCRARAQVRGDDARDLALQRLRPAVKLRDVDAVRAGAHDQLRPVDRLGQRDRARLRR